MKYISLILMLTSAISANALEGSYTISILNQKTGEIKFFKPTTSPNHIPMEFENYNCGFLESSTVKNGKTSYVGYVQCRQRNVDNAPLIYLPKTKQSVFFMFEDVGITSRAKVRQFYLVESKEE